MKTYIFDFKNNRQRLMAFFVIIGFAFTLGAPHAVQAANSCQSIFAYIPEVKYAELERDFLHSSIFSNFYIYKRKAILQKFTETQLRRGISPYESPETKALFDLAKILSIEDPRLVHGLPAKKKFVEAWVRHQKLDGLAKKMNLESSEVMAILLYSGGNYQAVNSRLRDAAERSSMYAFSKFLDHSLAKVPSYSGIVRRNVTWTDEAVEALQVGQVLEHQAYTSTSKNLSFSNFGNHTKFHIYSKNGKDISKLSAISHEKEVLFMTGSRFKILNIQKGNPDGVGGSKYIVTMVEVD